MRNGVPRRGSTPSMAWFGFSLAVAAVTVLFACGGVAEGAAFPAQGAGFVFLAWLIYRTGRRVGPPGPAG